MVLITMFYRKISWYLLNQICKYFFLILFIFLSVAWILQLTRLFTITNFVNIEFLNIFLLSLYLIPNIITVITPFILIFGLLLCFIKLNKDNELIAILSSGMGIKPFKDSLLIFSLIIIIVFAFLNFYLAPKIYEQYKIKEFDLRNTLDFKNISFSNFLNLNKSTILDFKKNNSEYKDIFISFNDESENIVFAKKGNIYNENNEYNFILSDGFKISVNTNKQIEKLEFLNYVLKIENKNNTNMDIVDRNTLTIFDDYFMKDYLNLIFKIIDILLILFVIFLFYNNNLKKINFQTYNNVIFSLLCVGVLILNQILKNSDIVLTNYLLFVLSVIFISLLISYIKRRYE